jgi:hypothetical protein
MMPSSDRSCVLPPHDNSHNHACIAEQAQRQGCIAEQAQRQGERKTLRDSCRCNVPKLGGHGDGMHP